MPELPLTSVQWTGTLLNLHGEELRSFLRQHRRELPLVRIGKTDYVPTSKLHRLLSRIAKRARPVRPAHIEELHV
jgi:hypothetical protein